VTGPALFMPVEEAAALLGVSRDLVYDLVHRGELPAVTLGRRIRIARKAIDDVVDRAMDGFDPDRLLHSLGADR
jgi:excisionase family DNA binding protein